MKRTLLMGIMLLSIPTAVVYADICSDLAAPYQVRITQLTADKDGALAGTSDPFLREAILASYQMQLGQLQLEMQSVLASAGCGGSGTDGGTGGTDGGTGGTDGGTGGTDGGTGGTDGGTGGTDGDGDDTSCKEKIEQFRADVAARKGTMKHSDLVHYINSRKVVIKDCLKKCDSNWGHRLPKRHGR